MDTSWIVEQDHNLVCIRIVGSDYSFSIKTIVGLFRSTIRKCGVVVDTLESSDIKELITLTTKRISNFLEGETLLINKVLKQLTGK